MSDTELSIVVVSGLPRSGTSAMMQMLEAGGVEPLTDGQRHADNDNPRGYYELESVKALRNDASILQHAPGKAVKVIHALVQYLPKEYTYAVLFMERDLDEVVASQQTMLKRSGRAGGALTPAALKTAFTQQLAQAERALAALPHCRVLKVAHRRLVTDPAKVVDEVAQFLDRPLNTDAMAASIDPSLYRQRS